MLAVYVQLPQKVPARQPSHSIATPAGLKREQTITAPGAHRGSLSSGAAGGTTSSAVVMTCTGDRGNSASNHFSS